MTSAPVFADTSFYLAALRADDPHHARALAELKINRTIITTEFILLELGNAFSRAIDLSDFLGLVEGLRTTPRVTLIPLDSGLLNRGLQRMAERQDKDWSLTDCISFLVMEDYGIEQALTADGHFEQAGFRALLRSH